MPVSGGLPPLAIRAIDEHTLEVDRGGTPLYLPEKLADFRGRSFAPGMRIQRAGYEVSILKAVDGQATQVRFHFLQSLQKSTSGRYAVDGEGIVSLRIVDP